MAGVTVVGVPYEVVFTPDRVRNDHRYGVNLSAVTEVFELDLRNFREVGLEAVNRLGNGSDFSDFIFDMDVYLNRLR